MASLATHLNVAPVKVKPTLAQAIAKFSNLFRGLGSLRMPRGMQFSKRAVLDRARNDVSEGNLRRELTARVPGLNSAPRVAAPAQPTVLRQVASQNAGGPSIAAERATPFKHAAPSVTASEPKILAGEKAAFDRYSNIAKQLIDENRPDLFKTLLKKIETEKTLSAGALKQLSRLNEA